LCDEDLKKVGVVIGKVALDASAVSDPKRTLEL
jgi:hypothetical protein